MKLISNKEQVAALLHNPAENFLSVALNYDGYRSVAPLILEREGKKTVFVRHIEVGNVRAMQQIEKTLPTEYDYRYYNTYMTFEPQPETTYATFAEAFASAAGKGGALEAQGDLPYSVYRTLSQTYAVSAEPMEDAFRYVYRLCRKEVRAIFAEAHKCGDAAAERLLANSPVRQELTKMMHGAKDRRFEVADAMMEKDGVDAWLLTSPLGVQELTGLGISHHVEFRHAALYLRGSEDVYLLAAEKLEGFGNAEPIDGLCGFVRTKAGDKRVGIEEQHCPVGLALSLEACVGDLHCSMDAVRLMREYRGDEDLAYFIIATRASVYATDGSLAWAKKAIENGQAITENDIFAEYQRLLQAFKQRNEIPFDIVLFWTNCHASKRSVIPSLPYDYPLDASSMAIKIDAGVSVRCEKGIHHAASDIARTILFEDAPQAVYDSFEHLMVHEVIPNIRSGMTPEDVYNMTIKTIEDRRDFFTEKGYMPAQKLSACFQRDVGHTLGLQEPVVLFFKQGNRTPLAAGMVGALEYQWSKNNYGIGVEDLFIIGENGSYNFSRDEL